MKGQLITQTKKWTMQKKNGLRKSGTGEILISIMTHVDTGNLTSCLDFLELFFTSEVWQLSVTQTNLYAEQKREPAERSVWYPVTESEMKAWLSLCLNMGLVTKPNISAYWSTDPVLSSPFPTSVMSRTRFLQILFYLHFANNNLAPPHDLEEHNKLFKI